MLEWKEEAVVEILPHRLHYKLKFRHGECEWVSE